MSMQTVALEWYRIAIPQEDEYVQDKQWGSVVVVAVVT
jgi:ElaB/YqjD/DUF883 family membrane-anchored ribosome-binding protein